MVRERTFQTKSNRSKCPELKSAWKIQEMVGSLWGLKLVLEGSIGEMMREIEVARPCKN